MKKKITNPIYNELKKLNLINNKNLILLSNRTRDKKIKVYQDKKTKVIFLEKNISSIDYYKKIKYGDNCKKKITQIKVLKKTIKYPMLEDDLRRFDQFKKLLTKKNILDFGCAWGNFLSLSKNATTLSGVELRKECLKYIKSKLKKIIIKSSLDEHKKKFDVVTMFHVLEHLPNQVNVLKNIRKKISKNGKIIIEVPHAEDFLLSFSELKSFKNFTFWSEHLILHTFQSLKKVLQKAGFKKIKIQYFQRYGYSNHLGWFIRKKPGGHKFFQNISSLELDTAYKSNLSKIKKTDTLIAIANV